MKKKILLITIVALGVMCTVVFATLHRKRNQNSEAGSSVAVSQNQATEKQTNTSLTKADPPKVEAPVKNEVKSTPASEPKPTPRTIFETSGNDSTQNTSPLQFTPNTNKWGVYYDYICPSRIKITLQTADPPAFNGDSDQTPNDWAKTENGGFGSFQGIRTNVLNNMFVKASSGCTWHILVKEML